MFATLWFAGGELEGFGEGVVCRGDGGGNGASDESAEGSATGDGADFTVRFEEGYNACTGNGVDDFWGGLLGGQKHQGVGEGVSGGGVVFDGDVVVDPFAGRSWTAVFGGVGNGFV